MGPVHDPSEGVISRFVVVQGERLDDQLLDEEIEEVGCAGVVEIVEEGLVEQGELQDYVSLLVHLSHLST